MKSLPRWREVVTDTSPILFKVPIRIVPHETGVARRLCKKRRLGPLALDAPGYSREANASSALLRRLRRPTGPCCVRRSFSSRLACALPFPGGQTFSKGRRHFGAGSRRLLLLGFRGSPSVQRMARLGGCWRNPGLAAPLLLSAPRTTTSSRRMGAGCSSGRHPSALRGAEREKRATQVLGSMRASEKSKQRRHRCSSGVNSWLTENDG